MARALSISFSQSGGSGLEVALFGEAGGASRRYLVADAGCCEVTGHFE
ncbi:MAG TPA: hypothetical protein VF940_00650 [Streptosporangiaceae bacterium]